MATGLLALLDDVAAIAKVAASSLDDVASAAGKASAKAAGIVIDDTAVTPRYVVGFTADRELPIIWKIARGSLKNKLLILLPAALALSWFAPWAITPLLMLGGLYLVYEGTEKVAEALLPHHAHAQEAAVETVDPQTLEDQKVNGAIATDFILSAEIMAISLATVADRPFMTRAIVLAIVGLLLTILVYGVVALIVKADDAGVKLARAAHTAPVRALGRALVTGMPFLLKALSVVGTAAMIWVGGGIILHGLEDYGLGGPAHAIHAAAVWAGQAMPAGNAVVQWIVEAIGAGVVGLVLGAALIPVVSLVGKLWPRKKGVAAAH
ncbi:MAG: DUF808 domain-containing protein [Beijerinckiaceae bacterium]